MRSCANLSLVQFLGNGDIDNTSKVSEMVDACCNTVKLVLWAPPVIGDSGCPIDDVDRSAYSFCPKEGCNTTLQHHGAGLLAYLC